MSFSPALLECVEAPSLDLPWERDVVALRRDFHQHPELGFHETRSAGIVARRLRALGYDVREGVGVTGVVATLDFGGAGAHVLVRADMDALPIEEENPWHWKSQTPGVMHACGHDCHMAIGLSAARLLSQARGELRGRVSFMFQPAEEGLGGAARMIEEGLLDGLDGFLGGRPDYALALHVWSEIEVGTIGLSSGAVMAGADEFRARIVGRGGHGALPHQTVDAVLVAAHLVTALQSVVARNLQPGQAGVVTVGALRAGQTFNVIPGQAQLEGTLRAFAAPVRTLLERRCREIVQTLPRAFGAAGEWEFFPGFPPTVNDEGVVARLRGALGQLPGVQVNPFEPTMGAEDMSLVLQRVPGCYFFVGGRSEVSGALWPHHHSQFNIDERALLTGTRALLAAVQTLLTPL